MARETPGSLAEQLSALLRDIDAAVVARFREPGSHGSDTRREGATQHRTPLLGVVVLAVRRLVGSAGRARSPQARSRRHG